MKLYFKTQDIKLYNGDALDSSNFNSEFIDLPVTSPPYNLDVNYDKSNDVI